MQRQIPTVVDDPLRGPGFNNLHPADSGDVFQFSKYMTALQRRWPLIVVCCLIAGIYAGVRYSLSEKVYKSTATIQIERKRLSLMALGQAGWLEDWWNLEYYPTQYRLLRSRGMAEKVVLNLQLHEDPAFNPAAGNLLTDVSPSDSLGTSSELAGLAGRLRGGLAVDPIKETQLVELSYESTSPELAARIANGYAEVFIEWGIEDRTSTVGQASSFLTAQIETLNTEVESRQRQLNAYASDSDYALDPGGEALVGRRQTLQEQYNTVMGERISLQAKHQGLVNLPRETVANSVSQGQASDLKSELFALESEYESKLALYTPEWPEMVTLQEKVNEKRDQLERLVDESYQEAVDTAFADWRRAKREEDNLLSELESLAVDARTQNATVLEYTNLNTYIETRKKLLAELVKRQSETEVASRVQTSQESNVRIVDRAIVPSKAFKPLFKQDFITALMLGLMFGVGTIVLIEYLDQTVKTPEELEALTGLPTLAVVPDIEDQGRGGGFRMRSGRGNYNYNYGYVYGYGHSKGDKSSQKNGDSEEKKIELLPHHSPRVAVSEAYRSLRTAMLLSSTEELRCIAITSAEPGEGKTATTTNLAVVMAQLGRRVLIIDSDLRRPRMHKVFKISNRIGLVNYLTSNYDLDELFFETGVPNLWICPSGPIPPNPSELLASDRMREALAAMRSKFDFVILDTPPTLPVADAVILGTRTDGVVICARAGTLLREDAKFCRERLSYGGLRILGTVLNRYRTTPGRYQKKYRYYGSYEEPGAPNKTHSAA